MLELDKVELYVPHEGTIKVGGATGPKIAGRCAFHFLEKKVDHIDFVCIGANANQQATKAMGVFRFTVISSFPGTDVAFQPLLYKANVPVPPDLETLRMVVITVWRTVILARNS